mmetsp:Transcript_32964/g.94741  ORF Transcript_32964/g.94741 Transcript_32964/m.94741 type:complete len:289 (-) Transcript_32964:536-1402(-)
MWALHARHVTCSQPPTFSRPMEHLGHRFRRAGSPSIQADTPKLLDVFEHIPPTWRSWCAAQTSTPQRPHRKEEQSAVTGYIDWQSGVGQKRTVSWWPRTCSERAASNRRLSSSSPRRASCLTSSNANNVPQPSRAQRSGRPPRPSALRTWFAAHAVHTACPQSSRKKGASSSMGQKQTTQSADGRSACLGRAPAARRQAAMDASACAKGERLESSATSASGSGPAGASCAGSFFFHFLSPALPLAAESDAPARPLRLRLPLALVQEGCPEGLLGSGSAPLQLLTVSKA